jgi:3-oxoacyl-[acyl-carrier-protein] synthase II
MSEQNHPYERVVVTGLGAISSVGNTANEVWNSLINGKSGADYITLFDRSKAEVQIACEVKGFDAVAHFGAKESRRLDRNVQFALIAAGEAIKDAQLKIDESNTHDIAVLTGTGIGGINAILNEHLTLINKGPNRVSPFAVPMMLPDGASGHIAMMFGIRGINFNITSACASSTNTIGEAFEMIRAGRVPAAITTGMEACINAFTLSAFHNMTALSTSYDPPQKASRPFDKNRNGFVPGEGAATLVVESLSHARARGAKIYCEIIGYGSTADAYHITAPDSKGAARAMQGALKRAGIQPHDVDYINAHGTSTPLNDASESRAINAVFGESAHALNVSSIKSMTGHTLGAAGALEALATVMTVRENIIPPTINYETPDPECDLNYTPNTAIKRTVNIALSNSFGFGGHNACVALKKFEG